MKHPSILLSPLDTIEPEGIVARGGVWDDADAWHPVSAIDALRESQRFIDRVAHASPVILYVFDLALNRNVFCNDAVDQILGYAPDEIRRMGGSLIPALIHPDDQPLLPALMARLAASADRDVVESEYRMRHASGEWRWLATRETIFLRDGDGAPRQVLGAAMDITDRKRAETALRDNQQRYALASAAGRVVVWGFEVASGQMRIEPPLPELLGLPPDEDGVGNGWEEHIHPDDRGRVLRLSAQVLDAAAPRDAEGNTPCPEIEYRAIGRDGAVHWLADRGTVLRLPNGKPYRAVGTITDITERKRFQEELGALTGDILRAQDDERRRIASDLHDGVAQDLAAIVINCMRVESLVSDLPLSDEARGVLAAAHELVERTLRELRTLTYLLHPPLLEEGGLPIAIRDYASGFAARTGIEVDVTDIEAIGDLSLDVQTALYRVVQECLVNIQRHSGSASAAICLAARPDEIVLEIRDHGRGISAGRQGTTNGPPAQAGVGIASMRERLHQLGGRLEFRTGSSGTTVIARLPRPDAH